jgi:hypothetical protein
MDMPEFAPAIPAFRPSLVMPAIAPALPAFGPSMDMPEFAPAIPAFRPSMDIKKEASRRRPLNGHPGLRITGS